MKLIADVHLVLRLKMYGVILTAPHASSCEIRFLIKRGSRQLTLCFIVFIHVNVFLFILFIYITFISMLLLL
jgi:hypothetical protein